MQVADRQAGRLLSAQSAGCPFYKISKKTSQQQGFKGALFWLRSQIRPRKQMSDSKDAVRTLKHTRPPAGRPAAATGLLCCFTSSGRHRSGCTFREIFIREQVSHHLYLYLTSAESAFLFGALCETCSHKGFFFFFLFLFSLSSFSVRLLAVGPLLRSGQRSRRKRHQREEKR